MSKEDMDKFERHFDEVAAMVPDEGEVAVLTRAELLSAMALAWACGQAHLAAGILTDPQAVFSGCTSAAMKLRRVAEACEEGARSVGVRTNHAVCSDGRDEEDDGDE